MQYVNCNLCDVDDTRVITTQDNYRVVQCSACGLVYLNPRPTPEMLIKLYNDYHIRNGKDANTWERLMKKNFMETSALLNRLFPERGRILDIGCGYGYFIKMMENAGWAAVGIEPSSRTSGYAKDKGLAVIETTIDDAEFPEESFDVITAFYVLEHLFDPLSAVRKIFMLLKPGGLTVLRVPNTTPIVKFLAIFKIKNNLYDLPFHLYDFSLKTIRLLFEKAGFSSIKVIPGSPTFPNHYGERAISLISGTLSQILFSISNGKLLLPGTSKTIIASKLDRGVKGS